MKNLIAVLAFVFMLQPVMADNKATVKFGPVQFVAGSGAVANYSGENLVITLGGNKGTTSGSVAIILEPSEVDQLEKGLNLGVASVDDDADGDSAVMLTLLGSVVKVRGTSATTTSYSSNNDSTAEGKFKVVGYNPDTKVLKFTLSAKLNPYTLSSSSLGQPATNTVIEKPLAVSIKSEIILP